MIGREALRGRIEPKAEVKRNTPLISSGDRYLVDRSAGFQKIRRLLFGECGVDSLCHHFYFHLVFEIPYTM